MTKTRPTFWIALLLGLPLTPAFCAPPIRCVHQTTVVKNGKATTHLILTTAKPGEAQTARNTADVTYPGPIRPRPYTPPYPNEAGEIVTNKSGTIAAVHFGDSAKLPEADYCPIYLFLSTEKGLTVLPDFDARVSRLLAKTSVRHNDGTWWPLHLWTPRQLYAMTITGRTLDFRIGAAEITEGTVHIAVAETGQLTAAWLRRRRRIARLFKAGGI